MSGNAGTEKLLADAVAEAELPGETVEQLDLLPLVDAEDVARALDAGETIKRPVGRPKGSLNRRTQEMRDYILARYRHPLIGLAETWMRPVEVLAAELGCDRLEAFKVQQAAMRDALPYLEQKLPQALQVDAGGVLPVQVVVSQAMLAGAIDAQGAPIEAQVIEPENPEKSEG